MGGIIPKDVCESVCFMYKKTDMNSTGIHQTNPSYAITNLEMPAMSPTMTEGGISGWKKKEGEIFVAGDVLLEIVCRVKLFLRS